MAAGLTMEQIVAVLNHDGGAKNMTELLHLLNTPAIAPCVFSAGKIRPCILGLASQKSRSTHIAFLYKIFIHLELREYVLTHPECLVSLTAGIRKRSAKILNRMAISLETVDILCEKSTKNPRKRKNSLDAQNKAKKQRTRKNATSLVFAPTEIARLDDPLPLAPR